MNFARLIQHTPLVHNAERAAEARAALPWASQDMADLLASVASCSPYLLQLMIRETVWLEQAVAQDPAQALSEELAQLAPGAPKEVSARLRTAKRRIALLTGLADCGGVWDLSQVTHAMTVLADRATEVAIKTILAPELSRGKIPGQGEADLETCAGLTVFSMGKGGAYELNYSSDIDLICLFDDTRYDEDDQVEARMAFSRVVRRAMRLLSDLTEGGYVFRTDLRLRPDPSVTPVAISMSTAERYYESLGRTWERAAFIKARAAAGDLAAGERFLSSIRPFIWRRHLDFATIEETQAMQAKIRAEKKTWDAAALDGRNLKLGPGGIREIEFFVQTRQLIAGGRDHDLRVRGTCEGLQRLSAAGWMPDEAASALTGHYTRLRLWEHRAQMVQDAQTHHLPKDDAGWLRMARFLGYADVAGFQSALRDTLEEVGDLTAPILLNTSQVDPEAAADPRHREVIDRWRGYPALRTERARTILARLLPDLLARFDKAAHPEEAISQFETFLSRLPAGVQVFSLFEANPQLIDLMVDISASSPALAGYLSRNAQVLDGVIDGAFFSAWPGMELLREDLQQRMSAEAADYETRLDTARRWHKDWHFRIGVHHLRGLIPARRAAEQYSDLAEATLRGLWPLVVDQFAEKHGPPPGRGAAVIGMGSLGARGLASTSDLDLIMVYDAPDGIDSEGRRPLAARVYYARLIKALITAVSAPMAEGTLYEVDMRLRPSGRQGPVATSLQSFKTYQENDAWVWEHMALTRARAVAGSRELGLEIERFRCAFLEQPADRDRVLKELAEMRTRLHEAKPARSPWDFDNGPGGRKDIELVAAAGALVAGVALRDPGEQLRQAPLGAGAASLSVIRDWYARLQILARLLNGGTLDPDRLGDGGRAMIERDFGEIDLEALRLRLHEDRERAKHVISALMSQ